MNQNQILSAQILSVNPEQGYARAAIIKDGQRTRDVVNLPFDNEREVIFSGNENTPSFGVRSMDYRFWDKEEVVLALALESSDDTSSIPTAESWAPKWAWDGAKVPTVDRPRRNNGNARRNNAGQDQRPRHDHRKPAPTSRKVENSKRKREQQVTGGDKPSLIVEVPPLRFPTDSTAALRTVPDMVDVDMKADKNTVFSVTLRSGNGSKDTQIGYGPLYKLIEEQRRTGKFGGPDVYLKKNTSKFGFRPCRVNVLAEIACTPQVQTPVTPAVATAPAHAVAA